jgi:hypothetical protein
MKKAQEWGVSFEVVAEMKVFATQKRHNLLFTLYSLMYQ